MIISEQVAAARALLRWTRKDLAKAARISASRVEEIEAEAGPIAAPDATVAPIRGALERAGILFVDENGDSPGVRVRLRDSRQRFLELEDLNASNDE